MSLNKYVSSPVTQEMNHEEYLPRGIKEKQTMHCFTVYQCFVHVHLLQATWELRIFFHGLQQQEHL